MLTSDRCLHIINSLRCVKPVTEKKSMLIPSVSQSHSYHKVLINTCITSIIPWHGIFWFLCSITGLCLTYWDELIVLNLHGVSKKL